MKITRQRLFVIFAIVAASIIAVCALAEFPHSKFFKKDTAKPLESAQSSPDVATLPFDHEEWERLITAHKSSPCLKTRTVDCLLQQAVNIRGASGEALKVGPSVPYEEKSKNDAALISAAINFGSIAAAEKLLPLLPAEAKEQRMHLLFLLGRYEEAMPMLHALQEEKKEGTDYDAIWPLIQRRDLDKAMELARLAIKWQYLDPAAAKGLTVTTRSGFCVSNDAQAYPRIYGVLALKMAQQERYDEAHELARMLVQYRKDELNGHKYSDCNWDFMQWAYEDAILGLADAYAQNGQREKAAIIYDEAQAHKEQMNMSQRRIAYEMKRNNFKTQESEILNYDNYAPLSEPRPEDAYYDQEVRQNADLAIMALSTNGFTAQALSKLEGYPHPNIQMNTLIKLGHASAKNNEQKLLALTLEQAVPLLGFRHRAIDNALDYIDIADLSYEASQETEARHFLNQAMEIFWNLRRQPHYRSLELNGKIVVVLAKLGDYADMAYFIRHNAFDYNGGAGQTFTEIMSHFASHEKWTEFDSFLERYGDLYKEESGREYNSPFVVRDSLIDQLISQQQYSRLMRVADQMMSEQSSYIAQDIVVAVFASKVHVPDEILNTAWHKTLANCIRNEDRIPEERLLTCYTRLMHVIQHKGLFSLTSGDVFLPIIR